MAATPKGPQKVRLDFNIDKQVYDDFARSCTKSGYAPNILIERLMKRYNETGQL